MRGHQYTGEERQFMEEYVPGHSYAEIQKAFTEKFGWEISILQVKGYISNHHLNTGRTGYFQKGHEPANKMKKGMCAAGCEKGWFKKGHRPHNYCPVGSERISADGYVEVKIADPRKWALKHRLVWEAANGKIPDGYVLIFRDNDKTNTDLDNLILVSRGIHAILNHEKLSGYSGEFKETAIKVAELKAAVSKAKKEQKKRKKEKSNENI
jgi:hypothetical protein